MGRAVARPTRGKAERLMDAKRALDMRLAGADDLTICAELRISRATLYRWITWALSQQIEPTIAQYRQEATSRIREQRRRLYATLNATTTTVDPATGRFVEAPLCGPSDVAALIGRLHALEDQEARLRGGYAPTKVDVSVRVADAFDELLAELNKTSPAATTTQEMNAR